MSAAEVLAGIDALFMDVDGVLTDGSFIWSTSGEEFKRFSFEDVMGLSRARNAGLLLGLISGEDNVLIDRFAAKLNITHVSKGCKDKGQALIGFSRSTGVPLSRMAYIGDDVNDLPALVLAGFSVAPANAQACVKARVSLVLERMGGHGAVRELIERIMESRASIHSEN